MADLKLTPKVHARPTKATGAPRKATAGPSKAGPSKAEVKQDPPAKETSQAAKEPAAARDQFGGRGLLGGLDVSKLGGLGGPIGDAPERDKKPPVLRAGLLGGLAPGAIGGALDGMLAKQTPITGRERARRAIAAAQAPPADHPYSQHIGDVQQRLRDRGLPTDAEGVRVRVVGDGPGHADMVTRVVGGQGIGIAPGADLSTDHQLPHGARPNGIVLSDREAGFAEPPDMSEHLFRGSVTLDGLIDSGARGQVGDVHDKRLHLAQVREEQPDDGKVTIANQSWGTTIARAAEGAAQNAVTSTPGTPLHKSVTEFLGHEPTPADRDAIARHVASGMQSKLEGEYKGDLASARQKLGTELGEARKENILYLVAAGNEGEIGDRLDNPAWTRTPSAGVPGLMTVGSTDLGDPTDVLDDKVSSFSNAFADLAAPGRGIPVSTGGNLLGKLPQSPLGGLLGPRSRTPTDVYGTSFASPYVAGTAALMAKANPNLNADQIAQILQDPGVLTNIAGSARDGAGVVDPVAAVEMAAAMGQ